MLKFFYGPICLNGVPSMEQVCIEMGLEVGGGGGGGCL